MESVRYKIGAQYVFGTNLNEPICEILVKSCFLKYSNIDEYGFVDDFNQNTAILCNYAAYQKGCNNFDTKD